MARQTPAHWYLGASSPSGNARGRMAEGAPNANAHDTRIARGGETTNIESEREIMNGVHARGGSTPAWHTREEWALPLRQGGDRAPPAYPSLL